MSSFDLTIRGGTIATAYDVFHADIGILYGRIVRGPRLHSEPTGDTIP